MTLGKLLTSLCFTVFISKTGPSSQVERPREILQHKECCRWQMLSKCLLLLQPYWLSTVPGDPTSWVHFIHALASEMRMLLPLHGGGNQGAGEVRIHLLFPLANHCSALSPTPGVAQQRPGLGHWEAADSGCLRPSLGTYRHLDDGGDAAVMGESGGMGLEWCPGWSA